MADRERWCWPLFNFSGSSFLRPGVAVLQSILVTFPTFPTPKSASATTECCSGILNWKFWKGVLVILNPDPSSQTTPYWFTCTHTPLPLRLKWPFQSTTLQAENCKRGEADFRFLSNHYGPFTGRQWSWQCSESVVPWPGSLLKDELVSYELPSSSDGIIESAFQNYLCIQVWRWERKQGMSGHFHPLHYRDCAKGTGPGTSPGPQVTNPETMWVSYSWVKLRMYCGQTIHFVSMFTAKRQNAEEQWWAHLQTSLPIAFPPLPCDSFVLWVELVGLGLPICTDGVS